MLLAIYLAVFLFSGGLGRGVLERTAQAAGRGPVALSASAGTTEGATVVTASVRRMEAGARPRADRGERGAGGLPLATVIPLGAPTVAPAALLGSVAWNLAARELRSRFFVVHAARGPPTARGTR